MHEFIPATDADRAAMLQAIGVDALEDLFADVPEEIRQRYEPLDLLPLTELEARAHLGALAGQNVDPTRVTSFLGAGAYDHDTPSAVNHLLLREEFLTCYTPYQAELSQGTLTWMFEFQTMVAEMTGMDVANSSMYDGASALAEAMLMSNRVTGHSRVAIAASVNPLHRGVLNPYAWAEGFEFVEIPYDPETGRLDRSALEDAADDTLAGLIVQSPNFFGVIEDLSGLKELLGKAFLIVSANPLSLGLLEPPGAFGADVVVAEGQGLGHPTQFGGPQVGWYATREEHVRRMPGRISGRTVDAEGREGYVMTLQAREQHIRRAKATSNICTNQALLALGNTIHLALLGKHGIRKLAELNVQKAHYLARELEEAGFERAFAGPFFNEFVVRVPDAAAVRARLANEDVLVLDPKHLVQVGVEDAFLLAVTEKRSRAQLDRLVQLMKES